MSDNDEKVVAFDRAVKALNVDHGEGCPRCLAGRSDVMSDPVDLCTLCNGTGQPWTRDLTLAAVTESLDECLKVCACAMRVIAEIDAGTFVGRTFDARGDAFVHEVQQEGVRMGLACAPRKPSCARKELPHERSANRSH